MHLAFVLLRLALIFDGAEKVGQIFVFVADIPTFVGELLIREVDPGVFFLKLLGIEFPGRLDGGGWKDHCVSRKGERGKEEQKKRESGCAVHGAYRLEGMSTPRSVPVPRLDVWLPVAAFTLIRLSPCSFSNWADALA